MSEPPHLSIIATIITAIVLSLTPLEVCIDPPKPLSLNIGSNCFLTSLSAPCYPKVYVMGDIIEDKLLYQLMMCESGGNPKAWNKTDPYGGAKGLFQYLQPTWDKYSKEYGIENPDIWNAEQQVELTKLLLADGKCYLWTCCPY